MKFSGFRLWAAASVLAIAVISFTWWDESDIIHSSLSLIAAVTGVMYTMLAGRGMVACYFFGLINAPLYAYLSWRWAYYGDMVLNLYYFAMMFPGLVCWRRNLVKDGGGEIVRTRLANRERALWLLVIAFAALALYGALRYVGGARPGCDALTNVLSVAAMILTVKRCIEQWVMWLAVDAIELVMWWHTGSSAIALFAMWALFLADGFYCFYLWLTATKSPVVDRRAADLT